MPGSYTLKGHRIEAPAAAPGLHVVATPIGHLDDITLRALETLAGCDLIACEDTRVTAKLLRHYGIETRLVAYHDHNAARRRPELLSALDDDLAVALVSDAGTPLISDPGFKLVGEVIAGDHEVIPVPGPSAALAALASAGLPTDAFFFAGFVPPKTESRKKRLRELATVPGSLVLYEAPTRLAAALADMAEVLGDREVVVARELTKRFEEKRRGSLSDIASHYAGEGPPKGEIVIVVGPPSEQSLGAEDADRLLAELLTNHSVSRAAAEAARLTGRPKRELYQRALDLSRDAG